MLSIIIDYCFASVKIIHLINFIIIKYIIRFSKILYFN